MDEPLILADTSLFCHVEKHTKIAGLHGLLEVFGERLAIVTDVERELRDHVRGGRFPTLNSMTYTEERGQFMRVPAKHLPPNLASLVGPVANRLPKKGKTGARTNYGEVATVLMARHLNVPAIVDDNDGRDFGRQKQVKPLYTTREVAVMLHANGKISFDQALAIWRGVYTDLQHPRHLQARLAAIGAR